MPRLIITKSGMSPLSIPTEFVPTMSGFMRSSIFVRGWLTMSLLNPMPVRPDCHAIENLFPGSKSGSLAHFAAFASKFGRIDGSSSVSHPFASRAVSSRPLVMTMMSRPVSWPACSCGRSSPKNESLAWISSL